MLSAFAHRLSPPILRKNVLSRAAFISKSTATSQSRSFMVTLLAKQEHPPAQHEPPRMPTDPMWQDIKEYVTKKVPPRKSPEEIWFERSERLEPNPPLDAYAGRSVPVKNGHIYRSLKSLANRLQTNKVYQTWKYQMRHEKKGVKRRRLRSQRWRRRFADEIRRKIVLVRSIQRRGQ